MFFARSMILAFDDPRSTFSIPVGYLFCLSADARLAILFSCCLSFVFSSLLCSLSHSQNRGFKIVSRRSFLNSLKSGFRAENYRKIVR